MSPLSDVARLGTQGRRDSGRFDGARLLLAHNTLLTASLRGAVALFAVLLVVRCGTALMMRVPATSAVKAKGARASKPRDREPGAEQGALMRRAEAGVDDVDVDGLSARDRLILDHIPLLRHVVGRMNIPPSFAREDVEGHGMIGLIAAADSFDESRGHKFSTYAFTKIRGAILDELRRMDFLPRGRRERLRELEAACSTLEQQNGVVPTARRDRGAARVSARGGRGDPAVGAQRRRRIARHRDELRHDRKHGRRPEERRSRRQCAMERNEGAARARDPGLPIRIAP
jgi:RNA polymerase sigma factor (sigma-70 family)